MAPPLSGRAGNLLGLLYAGLGDANDGFDAGFFSIGMEIPAPVYPLATVVVGVGTLGLTTSSSLELEPPIFSKF